MKKRILLIAAVLPFLMYGCSLTQFITTSSTTGEITFTTTSTTQATTDSTSMTTTESTTDSTPDTTVSTTQTTLTTQPVTTTTTTAAVTTETALTTAATSQEHTISFYNGEVLVLSYSAVEGEEILLPKNPFKLPTETNYYEFLQWNGYVENMVVSDDVSFYAEFTEHEFTLVSDTKTISEARHLAAVQYINQYLLQDYPEEALKIHHGTDAYKTALNVLVTDLVASATTDLEKIQIIYQWVKDTIVYDNECASPYPEDIFETLRGDCLPQALLMVDMFKTIGLPASIATGIRGSADIVVEENLDQYIGHAWALVYVDDKWELLDPLFDTFLPDLDYISSWYYTEMVDFTVPYYPNINLDAVVGVYYFDGLYYPVDDGVIQYELSRLSFDVDHYQITWRFNSNPNNPYFQEDPMKITPQGAAYTDGWVFFAYDQYTPYISSSSRILGQYRPNGQAVSATIYQTEDNTIHYFVKNSEYMQIEGIELEDLDLNWGTLEVEVGAHFKFLSWFDMIDHLYTVTYTIQDENLVSMDEFGYITALSAGEVVITYRLTNPSGGINGEGIIIFLIKESS